MIPLFGWACQSEVTNPPCLSLSASRSIERIAISALTPWRIWLVIVSEPAKDDVKLTSVPCSLFHFAVKPGYTPFSSDSFMIENPYTVKLMPPPVSEVGLGKQLPE